MDNARTRLPLLMRHFHLDRPWIPIRLSHYYPKQAPFRYHFQFQDHAKLLIKTGMLTRELKLVKLIFAT